MRYLLLALAACSHSDPPLDLPLSDARPVGDAGPVCSTGTIDGTLAANSVIHTFGPVVRAYETHDPEDGAPVLVLDEQPNPDAPCELSTTTGFNLALVLGAEPAPGTYTANTMVIGDAEQDGNADLAISTAGSARIDSATAACVTGSYTFTFGTHGTLEGAFAVMRCP
jgi:hypothetical protein